MTIYPICSVLEPTVTYREAPRPLVEVLGDEAVDDTLSLVRPISGQPARDLNLNVSPEREVLGQGPQPPRSAGHGQEVGDLEFLEDEQDVGVREVLQDLARDRSACLFMAPGNRTAFKISSANLLNRFFFCDFKTSHKDVGVLLD